ncbi:unnamed protein product [Rotaria sordida]|nr:unnamed protein product [Rotaria sordida]
MRDFFDVSATILHKDFPINPGSKHENDAEKNGFCGTRYCNQSLDNTYDNSERTESVALVATLIYKHYAHTKYNRNYIQSVDKFEDLTVQILEKLYEANPHAFLKSIIRQIPSYADAKEFIVHRAVQDLFNDIWFGYIKESVSYLKIFFSTFILWYSGFLPYN